MSQVDHLISQPSLDISPIWTPIMLAEVRKIQLDLFCKNDCSHDISHLMMLINL
jgi:hypothetical protein